MLERTINSMVRLYRQRTGTMCVLTALIVLAIDYITGEYMEFPLL
jgi:hypothetical protein